MKIYQVSIRANDSQPNQQEHLGYEYFDAKKYAENFVSDHADTYDCEITVLEFPVSKSGLLRALNMHGAHPGNG